MPRLVTPATPSTYFCTQTASDLTGPTPSDWSNVGATTAPGSSTLACDVPNSTTERNYIFSQPGVPGTGGATGDYTLTLQMVATDSNVNISFQVHRVNASGTIQSSSSTTPEQVSTSGNPLTFSRTAVNLGTWNAGDRIRADVIVRNTAAHGSNRTVSFDLFAPGVTTVDFTVAPKVGTALDVTSNQTFGTEIAPSGNPMGHHNL